MTPTVPQSPSAAGNMVGALRPEDYNPDIAAAKMAQELVKQMGAPAVVSKEFVVRKGIWEALNHREPVWDKEKLIKANDEIDAIVKMFKITTQVSNPNKQWEIPPRDEWISTHQREYEAIMKQALLDPGNRTGIDCTLRIAIYNNVAKNSVNIDGKYFMAIWQYLMKPKYTIVQSGTPPGNNFEEQPSLGRRLLNRITGGGKQNNAQPNQ